MTAPTPNPFQMVAQVMALADGQDCSLHVTVTRAEPIDRYVYRNETRYKQFLVVEDGARGKVGVRWFSPKFDLRAGDIIQMWPMAKSDRSTCKIETDTSGKRIVKVSALAMVLTNGPERAVVLPQEQANAAAATQPAAGGAPPDYGQRNGGQANGGPAPARRERYDHRQILALQRATFLDRLVLVEEAVGLRDVQEEVTLVEMMEAARRMATTVVIGVVDGKVDLAPLEDNGEGSGDTAAPASGTGGGPPPEYQPPGGQPVGGAEDDDIPF